MLKHWWFVYAPDIWGVSNLPMSYLARYQNKKVAKKEARALTKISGRKFVLGIYFNGQLYNLIDEDLMKKNEWLVCTTDFSSFYVKHRSEIKDDDEVLEDHSDLDMALCAVSYWEHKLESD
jgi:hypothetical protein